ncbi:armadillo repeat protein deleted in velo-cardio-facial syndrome isoform x1 [Limosa lapponica baueri]|uniref:Armadillo repeat protein deleted in velo-cardio-facial syndrome isoform x1 n=1 Tax=Limosa lapponica baueri TaxID=1758121 RepID=A0A2I0T281_LIMLA|nr:armadillo repeat protein deleted in velo-cardio-facial syndrome isoform x1 [Limosa lapponica baueri]
MDDYDIRSAASILASVKEQEARFERLTRALEEERRNVSLQLERANPPADRLSICNIGNGQPLATAWQQLVLQVTACPFYLFLESTRTRISRSGVRCIAFAISIVFWYPRAAVLQPFISRLRPEPSLRSCFDFSSAHGMLLNICASLSIKPPRETFAPSSSSVRLL